MANQKQMDFCREVYHAAERINEISPVFIAAQACLESNWGQKRVGKYNIFGITKGSKWTGKTTLVFTTEFFNNPNVRFNAPEKVVSITKITDSRYRYKCYRLFKDFNSLEECLQEHLRLFKQPGYADAWPYRKNAREFAKRIADNQGCKYATAPNYYKVMLAMISSVEHIIRLGA